METPCIKECELHRGKCVACKRTIEEIKSWCSLTEKERNIIMRYLKKRK